MNTHPKHGDIKPYNDVYQGFPKKENPQMAYCDSCGDWFSIMMSPWGCPRCDKPWSNAEAKGH